MTEIREWLLWHSPTHYIRKWWYQRHPAPKEEVDALFDEAKGYLWDMQRELEEKSLDTPETIEAILEIDKLLEGERNKHLKT